MATTTSTNPKDSSSSLTQAFAKWREHLCQWTGLGLTPEEHEVWLKKNTSKLQQQEHERCEQWKSEWIQKSPIVKFLMEHLEVAGCKFSSKHFYCQPCDALRSGGFSPEYGIVLCENRLLSKSVTEDTLAHELIHAIDHCRANLDWTNCHHHACTEIRAASLSGDCRLLNEFKRGHFGLFKQHQTCVKRRALLSLKENPACKSLEVCEEAIHDVWQSCFSDTWPFDEIFK